MGFEESLHFPVCLFAFMVSEQGACPILGEEDVAGALHFLKHFQSRTDILYRISLAQRVVEVSQGAGCPRFDASVLGFQERLEEGIHLQGVRRHGLYDEVELTFPVGVGDSLPLGVTDTVILPRSMQGQLVG